MEGVVQLTAADLLAGTVPPLPSPSSDANTDEAVPEYFFRVGEGTIHVFPYLFDFTTNVRKRWAGRALLEMFREEFPHERLEYWEQAIDRGRITVDGKLTPRTAILRPGQRIVHRTHRHERPVACVSPTVVHEDSEFVAVVKPAGLPVHPCGRYRFNSLLSHLAAFRSLKGLLPVHRLDTGTSGIIILARNADVSRRVNRLLESQSVHKEYLAELHGHLNADTPTPRCVCTHCVNATLGAEANAETRIDVPTPLLECKQPVGKLSHKPARHGAGGSLAKESHTIYRVVSYCSHADTTTVQCWPVTGRTHQLRVHFAWLGCPMVGDPLYHSRDEVLPERFTLEGGGAATEVLEEAPKRGIGSDAEDSPSPSKRQKPADSQEQPPHGPSPEVPSEKLPFIDGRPRDSLCGECSRIASTGSPYCLEQPENIHLHARRFKGAGLSVSAPLPSWALERGLKEADLSDQWPTLPSEESPPATQPRPPEPGALPTRDGAGEVGGAEEV